MTAHPAGTPRRPAPVSTPSRRSFLGATAVAAGGAAAAAGVIGAVVGWSTARPTTHRSTVAGATPASAPVLEAAVRREQDLIQRLDAAAASTPTLATRVTVLVADHQAHLESLQALVRAAGAAPVPLTSGSGPAPAGAVASKADLLAWEKQASAAAARDSAHLFGDGAVLLGAISACDASHAAWLG